MQIINLLKKYLKWKLNNNFIDVIDFIFDRNDNLLIQYFSAKAGNEYYRLKRATPSKDEYNEIIQFMEFENIPEEIEDEFGIDEYDNCRQLADYEIIYWSRNKIDCERFLNMRKYNI